MDVFVLGLPLSPRLAMAASKLAEQWEADGHIRRRAKNLELAP